MSKLFDQHTTFLRNMEIFAANIDDEVVMMDEKLGHYFGLNTVAAKIWALLETPLSLQVLINQLVTLYEVSLEECQRDVEIFLMSMLQHQLVKIVET